MEKGANTMKIKFILLIVVIGINIANAGDISRKGTTGGEQLLIPVGARSIATGGAFLSNTTGVEAIYYNPAGLSGSDYSEVTFSFMDYIADIKHTYFAASYNAGSIGSFAIALKNLSFGDIPVTTIENPDPSFAVYSPRYYTLSLTYSKNITDRVRAGVNIKYINEEIMSTGAQGLAFDFGVQYKFKGNLWIGVSLKNIGGNMKYSGTDLQVKTGVPKGTQTSIAVGSYEPVSEPFQLPSMFEVSLAYKLDLSEQNSLMLGTSFRNNSSREDLLSLGTELQVFDILFLRLGYENETQSEGNSEFGMTYGGGIAYSVGGSVIEIDYAYRTFKSFKGNQVVGIKFRF